MAEAERGAGMSHDPKPEETEEPDVVIEHGYTRCTRCFTRVINGLMDYHLPRCVNSREPLGEG